MRPILALITTVAVIGSVAFYGAFIRALPPIESVTHEVERATGLFSVDLTLTFDAVTDSAFSIDADNPDRRHSIELTFRGQKFFVNKLIKAGSTVEMAINDVRVGSNSFHIEINVPDLEFGRAIDLDDEFGVEPSGKQKEDEVTIPSRAVRIRVLRDGVPMLGAEKTIWSEPGQKVSGEVLINVPAFDQPTHDHAND